MLRTFLKPLSLFLFAAAAGAQAPDPIVTPDDARLHGLESLRTVVADEGVPLPDNLDALVRNAAAARLLGKALFFDMAVGSDGVQACASCHFHAGADPRARNQINPDLLRVVDDRRGDVVGFFEAEAAPDTTFEVAPPNGLLDRGDFPFVRDIGNGANVIDVGGVLEPAPGNSNDIASSQGVLLTDFVRVVPGADVDVGVARFDQVFNRFGNTVRRVEPRNTPTVINAVFNFHNFWDGRANHFFNGVDPFGQRSLDARIFVAGDLPDLDDDEEGLGGDISAVSLALNNASLASQAVGPPLSDFEMSFAGRSFPDLGRKLLPRRALAVQAVHPQDSLLSAFRHPSGLGLSPSYQQIVRVAFHPQLWASGQRLFFPPGGGGPVVVDPGTTDPDRTFTLMEANFALFFGVAVMMYEATLVSDDTPFDRWMQRSGQFVPGFGPNELAGLNLFVGKGKCVNCHGGPELTNASVRNAQRGANLIEPMLMGDQRPAFYDNGFYNISVTPTVEDLGRGAADAFGKPLASSRAFLFEALGIDDIPFPILGAPVRGLVEQDGVLGAFDEDTGDFLPVCVDLDGDGRCGEEDELLLQRNAVDGAMKTPGMRNQLFMGPYFHNGAAATLMEVVEFYDRGGNFCRLNGPDLDPDIQPIGFTRQERVQLVSFLIALTDERVRRKRAPFDGPQLFVPDGHAANGTTRLIEIPAVGRTGVGSTADAPQPFLNADPFLSNPVDGDRDAQGRVRCSPNFPPPPATD